MRMQRSHVDVREERRFFIDWLESGHVERQQANGILKKNAEKEIMINFLVSSFLGKNEKKCVWQRIPSR